MHGFSDIEPPGLEQFVRRRAAPAPPKVLAAMRASIYSVADLFAEGEE